MVAAVASHGNFFTPLWTGYPGTLLWFFGCFHRLPVARVLRAFLTHPTRSLPVSRGRLVALPTLTPLRTSPIRLSAPAKTSALRCPSSRPPEKGDSPTAVPSSATLGVAARATCGASPPNLLPVVPAPRRLMTSRLQPSRFAPRTLCRPTPPRRQLLPSAFHTPDR